MDSFESTNYERIAKAIQFLVDNHKQQPSLEMLAEHLDMSIFHLQRLFSEWAGISPKQFQKYINIQQAKKLLKEKQLSLFDTTYEIGLSSTSRLHDLFISIEAMSPAEYKDGAAGLFIKYNFYSSRFGNLIVASTIIGICYLAFFDTNKDDAFVLLKEQFPFATFVFETDGFHQLAIKIIDGNFNKNEKLKLHIKGTSFQLKVWEALLKIPFGGIQNYGQLANIIQKPKASRAVGSAIGDNPIAFLIPCHRVIQSTGLLGGYMWGVNRKAAIIAWETSVLANNTNTEQ